MSTIALAPRQVIYVTRRMTFSSAFAIRRSWEEKYPHGIFILPDQHLAGVTAQNWQVTAPQEVMEWWDRTHNAVNQDRGVFLRSEVCSTGQKPIAAGREGVDVQHHTQYTTYSNPRDFHIRLKFHGSAAKIEFFNWLMTDIDSDWPYAPQDMLKSSAKKCEDCGGMLYRSASYAQSAIAALAAQVNAMDELPGHLYIKYKLWQTGGACEETAIEYMAGGVN